MPEVLIVFSTYDFLRMHKVLSDFIVSLNISLSQALEWILLFLNWHCYMNTKNSFAILPESLYSLLYSVLNVSLHSTIDCLNIR